MSTKSAPSQTLSLDELSSRIVSNIREICDVRTNKVNSCEYLMFRPHGSIQFLVISNSLIFLSFFLSIEYTLEYKGLEGKRVYSRGVPIRDEDSFILPDGITMSSLCGFADKDSFFKEVIGEGNTSFTVGFPLDDFYRIKDSLCNNLFQYDKMIWNKKY